MPAYDRTRSVVPVTAVFGANASGKSNLLDAMRWMQSAVRHSYARWEAGTGIPRSPFRLDVAAVAEPSVFVVDLFLDGVQYVYGFALNDTRVEEEWLYAYPHRHKRVVFERNGQHVELGSTVSERRGRADLLAGLLRENSLLLSVAVQAKQQDVFPVYQWFRERLRIVDERFYLRRPGLLSADRVGAALSRYPEFVELLKAADLGISDVRVVETVKAPSALDHDRAQRLEAQIAEMDAALTGDAADDVDERRALLRSELEWLRSTRRRKELVFLHGPESVALGPQDQSDGTLSWVGLLMSGLDALATGAVMATDEIDASLHPRLTARLIELFRSSATNPNGAQLLFTTHDATLLGTSLGEEILHRDEIWFVEKRDGTSRLYPLSDFHPRKGENRERRYLAGSYGGVPAVFTDSLVDSVLRTRAEELSGPA